MKKVVFILVLVALVIGSVYAGSVVAAPGKTGGHSPLTKSYMDWVSSNQNETILTSDVYNTGAHFSVTINATSIAPGEMIQLQMNWGHLPAYVGDWSGWISKYEQITSDGLYKYEFDAGSCQILTSVSDGVGLAYSVTVTY
jgi:hypothetical protein